jgi:hypothetical protein
MRSFGEEAKTEESSCGGAWAIGRLGAERAQEARQPKQRSQGRFGQKPQEDYRGQAQCSPPAVVDDARKTEHLGRDNSQPFWASRYRSRRRRQSFPFAVEGRNTRSRTGAFSFL